MITPVAPRDLPGAYFRYARLPVAVVTAAGMAVGWLVAELPGLWGALLGGVTVLIFFGVDLFVMRMSVDWSPVATFAVVITEYLAKLIALALVLAAVRETSAVDPTVMGATMGVAAVAFLTALVVGHLRIKTFSVDPEAAGSDRT